MIRVWLPLLTFFFFVFDGTVMQVFSSHWFGASYQLIPRFAFAMILFIAFFLNRSTALIYGLIFGLLSDIVYTDLIGVYFFSMAFSAYLMASFASLFRPRLIAVFLLGLMGMVLLEFQAYALYSIIGYTELPMKPFLYNRLFPSLVLNGVFIILMYYPVNKVFAAIETARRQESDEVRG
ncbi:MAG TPA: rod shape-determining protein MreD [Bacillales bacterium]|nr:rod shape-determining protein MreD [Bacillales bacterium]